MPVITRSMKKNVKFNPYYSSEEYEFISLMSLYLFESELSQNTKNRIKIYITNS